ncbi:hypothetical protein D3C72_2396190 [compost metagenome]
MSRGPGNTRAKKAKAATTGAVRTKARAAGAPPSATAASQPWNGTRRALQVAPASTSRTASAMAPGAAGPTSARQAPISAREVVPVSP